MTTGVMEEKKKITSAKTESLSRKLKAVMIITSLVAGTVLLIDAIDSSFLYNEETVALDMSITLNNIWRANKTKERFFILFLIPSLPSHGHKRDVIRATWMNISRWSEWGEVEERYKRIKVMFIFGQMRNEESTPQFIEEVSKHDDMFLFDELIEHRTILKYKVMWGMKRSMSLYDYDYLVKTDDDVLVNLPLVIKKLIPMRRNMLYTGTCAMRYGGFRGYPKWKYCSGGGYVLSYDLVSEVNKLGPSVHRVPFRPEDGYTGWLVYNVNIMTNFSIRPETTRNTLQVPLYKCGPFIKWFYHGMKETKTMSKIFDRLKSNSPIEC